MAEALAPQGKFPIAVANPADLDALFGVMEHANAFAAAQSETGTLQWAHIEVARAGLRRHIEAGGCYAMRDDGGQIVASVSVAEADTFAWGDQGVDGSALYFYKLMRDPTGAPKGSGLKLLGFVAATALQLDKEFVRCDLKPGNRRLVAWYERLSFRVAGTSVHPVTDEHYLLMEADRVMLMSQINQLQK